MNIMEQLSVVMSAVLFRDSQWGFASLDFFVKKSSIEDQLSLADVSSLFAIYEAFHLQMPRNMRKVKQPEGP